MNFFKKIFKHIAEPDDSTADSKRQNENLKSWFEPTDSIDDAAKSAVTMVFFPSIMPMKSRREAFEDIERGELFTSPSQDASSTKARPTHRPR